MKVKDIIAALCELDPDKNIAIGREYFSEGTWFSLGMDGAYVDVAKCDIIGIEADLLVPQFLLIALGQVLSGKKQITLPPPFVNMVRGTNDGTVL